MYRIKNFSPLWYMKKQGVTVAIATGLTIAAVIGANTADTAAETYTPMNTPTAIENTAKTPEIVFTGYNVPLDQELQIYIKQICTRYGIDTPIVLAIIQHESNFKADTVGDGGESYGLMQVQPKWHAARMEKLGVTNLLDPYENVLVGVDFLAELLETHGNIEIALTVYNRGSYDGTVTQYATDIIASAYVIGGTAEYV